MKWYNKMRIRYEQVYHYMIIKLEHDLPPYLTYHDVEHTQGVIDHVEVIAAGEGIMGDQLYLLKTAALFHDAGFLLSTDDHEKYSCKLAQDYLPIYDYTVAEIDEICTIIGATRLPQNPTNRLGEILCDADLFYLGGAHYDEQAVGLYREMTRDNEQIDSLTWKNMQYTFLTSHRYFTKTARAMQDVGKRENLRKLRDELGKMDR